MHIFIVVLDFKIIETTFLLSLLGLHLPLDLLLHDDTVLPVPVPVGDWALYTVVFILRCKCLLAACTTVVS